MVAMAKRGATGWVDDPKAVGEVLGSLPNPLLRTTRYCSDLVKTEHRDILPWAIEESVLGRRLKAHYQARGTCVSQGWSRGIEHLIQAEIQNGEREEWKAQVLPAAIYGLSRVEVGGGRLRGDGSVGAWAAKAVRNYGVLLRIRYPGFDCRGPDDEKYAIDWGRRGLPDALEPIAKNHFVSDVSLVNDADVGLGCLYNLKPIPICSNQGFTTTRDEYGMCRPKGTWNHCMLASGVMKIKHSRHPNGRIVVAIWQSWGNKNPNGNRKVVLQTGATITLPPEVFLIDVDVWDRILRQGDSFAMAGMVGWKPQKQDFFLAHVKPSIDLAMTA